MDIERLSRRYGLSEERLSESGLTWDDLHDVEEDYARIKGGLDSVGSYVVDALLKCPKVHSIKYRLKDTEHVLEKIVRKRGEDKARVITVENYRSEITDLVGIRALHLFKDDWLAVHDYIKETWELTERPLAYVRAGDSEKIIEFYKQNDCEVREHRFGYRSVHYLISSNPDRERYIVEIQARTVFEEAWGEIDHVMSYPYTQDNELLLRLSSILNRLAANADELGSYMRYLKSRTDLMQEEYAETIDEKNLLISELQKKIDRLEIDASQKAALTSDLVALGRNRSNEAQVKGEYPFLEHLMDSDLIKGISERIERVMQSEEFDDFTLTEEDLRLLTNAQRDLLKMLDNPAEIRRVLASSPLHHRLPALMEPTSGEKDSKPAPGDITDNDDGGVAGGGETGKPVDDPTVDGSTE